MTDMGRTKTTSSGLPENLTVEGGRYRYRNPETGKRTSLGVDRKKAIEAATKVNRVLAARRQARLAAEGGAMTISAVIDGFMENVVPRKPWSPGTRANWTFRLAVLKREIGKRAIATTDRVFLADWLDARGTTGDVHNKWRTVLIDLWRYAIARKWVDFNEAEATMARSTSKILPENHRKRQRLELAQFWDIHDHPDAPAFLRIAMEQSLITLQARNELCNMRRDDYRDGWLYVIRKKVAGESEAGFIRIRLTPQLEDIRARSMADGVPSPYLVHYRPASRRRKHVDAKPHWTCVTPEYLSKAFAEIRDKTAVGALSAEQRPTFHEIRSLGARLYRAAGYSEEYIQALMAHADIKTTDIYLEGRQLADDDYFKVEAGMTLDRLR